MLSSTFVLDMSLIDYSTSASGALTNTLSLSDATLPGGVIFFDAVTSAQTANVTGGRYTFTSGAGWLDTGIHSEYRAGNPFTGPIVPEDKVWSYDAGGYAYSEGGADIANIDWQFFRNPL